MQGIIARAFLEDLLAVLHLVVEPHGLGGVEALPATAAEVHHTVKQLGLVRLVTALHEILGPDNLGGVDVTPETVVGIVELVCTVHVGTVADGLGRVVRNLPFLLRVCAAENASLGAGGVVEQRRSHDEGHTATESEHAVFVYTALGGTALFGQELVSLVKVAVDEFDALVEVLTGLGKIGTDVIVGLVHDHHAAVALDKVSVSPGAEEIRLAEQARLHFFTHR